MRIHTHADGHVGPLALSTNWMPLLTNGLLKPHLQCTIRLSSPLYPPRTLCVCKHVPARTCVYVRGQSLLPFLNVACASIRSLWVVSLKGSAMVTFNLVQPSNTEDTTMWINDSNKSNVECIHCRIPLTQCGCISLLLTFIVKTTMLRSTMSCVFTLLQLQMKNDHQSGSTSV